MKMVTVNIEIIQYKIPLDIDIDYTHYLTMDHQLAIHTRTYHTAFMLRQRVRTGHYDFKIEEDEKPNKPK